jgi:hypothetical protein
VCLQAVERDNEAWHEKCLTEATEKVDVAAEDKASKSAPADASHADASAEAEAMRESGSDEEDGMEDAPHLGFLEYVMFRVDRRSKASRGESGGRGGPAVDWEALNDEAKESIVEIVNDRREAIERIVHGMRWP